MSSSATAAPPLAPTSSTTGAGVTGSPPASQAPTTSLATTTSGAPDVETGATQLPCEAYVPETPPAYVADTALDEISGVAFSRTNPGLIWVHNDSGGASRLSGLFPSGQTAATIDLTATLALDWEDIGAGPGADPGAGSSGRPDSPALYVADIGDNLRIRPTVAIYRLPEPVIAGAGVTIDVVPERLDLVYPDGRHDAETLLVDPLTHELVIVTKSGGGIYVAAGDFSQDGAVMTAAGKLTEDDLLVTGGDIDGAGSTIVLRTPDRVLLFERKPGVGVADALQGPSCDLPVADEPQGESVAISPDGTMVVTISEGLNPAINRLVVP